MKFLCDRCKTRYSIGDDRVRGKILKIRCKNCANVITVREGMTDEGGIDPPQRGRPTTGAPNPAHTSNAENGSGSALGAAFAAQLTKPPAALEEEWYVSIDGAQQGPFSLSDAQKWVANQTHDADLYCWSEGFDDWLPVDKVSHFRNLRKKPVAPAPPPLPRVSPARTEETPKPLFAATMASLERSDSKVSALPPMAAGAAAVAPAVSPTAHKANGAAAPIPSVAKGTGTSRTPVGGVTPMPAGKSGPVRPNPAQGVGNTPAKMSAGAAALAAAFDDSEDSGDQMTAIEAPSFADEVATRAEPVAAKRTPIVAEPSKPAAAAAKPAPSAAPSLDDDDDMEIGEVSRVVNLADIAKGAASRRSIPQMPAVGRNTSPVPRISANGIGLGAGAPAAPQLAPMQPGLAADPMLTPPAPGESVLATAPESSHRRSMIILLAFAGVLLLGVAGAVILLVANGSDSEQIGLGKTAVVNTFRPDDPTGHRPNDPIDTQQGSATVAIKPPIKRTCPPFCGGQSFQQQPKNPIIDEDPNLKKLDASEVEDYANKQNGITQRCFMRAQKGVDGILVGEVKKIFVTLSIDRDGSVSDVQLSEHGADALGRCLTPAIKRWKFRTSPGGTYKFALAFANG